MHDAGLDRPKLAPGQYLQRRGAKHRPVSRGATSSLSLNKSCLTRRPKWTKFRDGKTPERRRRDRIEPEYHSGDEALARSEAGPFVNTLDDKDYGAKRYAAGLMRAINN
jgi:hypothetical protein